MSLQHHHQQRRRCSGLSVPIFVGLIVVAEILFLGRLDFAVVENWTTSFYFPSSSIPVPEDTPSSSSIAEADVDVDDADDGRRCEEWLEKVDTVPYSRDFGSDPVLVSGATKVLISPLLLLGI